MSESITSDVKTMRTAVAEEIASAGPQIMDMVVKQMAAEKIEARATALRDTINKIMKLERELKALRPDICSFDEEGKEISKAYKKETIQTRQKTVEQINKMKKLVADALGMDADKAQQAWDKLGK